MDAGLIPNFVQKEEEECVDWPVKQVGQIKLSPNIRKQILFQCKLEKKTVKKVKPETWCEKMSQNVCAPSNCVIAVGEKVSSFSIKILH